MLSLFAAELAKDELEQRGYSVLAGYMSPVNDAYKKKVPYILWPRRKHMELYVHVLLIEFRFKSCLGSLTGCSSNSLL